MHFARSISGPAGSLSLNYTFVTCLVHFQFSLLASQGYKGRTLSASFVVAFLFLIVLHNLVKE